MADDGLTALRKFPSLHIKNEKKFMINWSPNLEASRFADKHVSASFKAQDKTASAYYLVKPLKCMNDSCIKKTCRRNRK